MHVVFPHESDMWASIAPGLFLFVCFWASRHDSPFLAGTEPCPALAADPQALANALQSLCAHEQRMIKITGKKGETKAELVARVGTDKDQQKEAKVTLVVSQGTQTGEGSMIRVLVRLALMAKALEWQLSGQAETKLGASLVNAIAALLPPYRPPLPLSLLAWSNTPPMNDADPGFTTLQNQHVAAAFAHEIVQLFSPMDRIVMRHFPAHFFLASERTPALAYPPTMTTMLAVPVDTAGQALSDEPTLHYVARVRAASGVTARCMDENPVAAVTGAMRMIVLLQARRDQQAHPPAHGPQHHDDDTSSNNDDNDDEGGQQPRGGYWRGRAAASGSASAAASASLSAAAASGLAPAETAGASSDVASGAGYDDDEDSGDDEPGPAPATRTRTRPSSKRRRLTTAEQQQQQPQPPPESPAPWYDSPSLPAAARREAARQAAQRPQALLRSVSTPILRLHGALLPPPSSSSNFVTPAPPAAQYQATPSSLVHAQYAMMSFGQISPVQQPFFPPAAHQTPAHPFSQQYATPIPPSSTTTTHAAPHSLPFTPAPRPPPMPLPLSNWATPMSGASASFASASTASASFASFASASASDIPSFASASAIASPSSTSTMLPPPTTGAAAATAIAAPDVVRPPVSIEQLGAQLSGMRIQVNYTRLAYDDGRARAAELGFPNAFPDLAADIHSARGRERMRLARQMAERDPNGAWLGVAPPDLPGAAGAAAGFQGAGGNAEGGGDGEEGESMPGPEEYTPGAQE